MKEQDGKFLLYGQISYNVCGFEFEKLTFIPKLNVKANTFLKYFLMASVQPMSNVQIIFI